MDYQDIVIGSGLAALGAVIGLEGSASVLVLSGSAHGSFQHYDKNQTVPSAFTGFGGLGNHWHGVIPTALNRNFADTTAEAFASLFSHFYPGTAVQDKVGANALFVPWRPIRPAREFARLQQLRGERLRLAALQADSFRWTRQQVEVRAEGQTFRARRLWLAAGVLHTPQLIDQSFQKSLSRESVDDHITCYIGQTREEACPRVQRASNGLFFPARYSADSSVLYTLRPAHFAFAKLDHAIEARAVFGLPTGNAVAKILRRASPALVAEALYNRFGLMARAKTYSVMAQVPVPDAYERPVANAPMRARETAMAQATEWARSKQPFEGVHLSRRPELRIPGIHLHHSLDTATLQAVGIDLPGEPIQVVDASTLCNIGPDHHSFKMMLAAEQRTRRTVSA